MHRKVARAYDYLKREHDRIRAAHVKILAQNDRHLERRLFRADLDSSRRLDEMLLYEERLTRPQRRRVALCPTLPFSNEDMREILAATGLYQEEMPSHGVANGKRIRGLVLLLRYTGMRIGDAVNFSVERLKGNRVFLYTQKTGVAVNTVLPDFVVDALATTPKVTDKFCFWSGIGKLESIVRR